MGSLMDFKYYEKSSSPAAEYEWVEVEEHIA